MSTNCKVAYKEADGTYASIYCHYDGYVYYMLPMLRNNYNNACLASELIDFGDASSIQERLHPNKKHTFDDPQDGVCIFYHRDRGEPWEDVAPIRGQTKAELLNEGYYSYVFEDGHWTAYVGGEEYLD